jgi:hypothetical protein
VKCSKKVVFLSHLSAAKQFKHFMDILPDMFSALKQILRGKNPRLYFEFVMLYDTSEVAKAAFEPLGDVLPNLNNKSKEEIFYEKYRNQYPEDAAYFYKKMIGLALPRGKQDCYELILRMLSCLSKIPKEKETLLHLINVMIETYPNRQVFVNMLKEYIKVLVLNPW